MKSLLRKLWQTIHPQGRKNAWLRQFAETNTFKSSNEYWQQRYCSVMYSGPGSYGKVANYKANVITQFMHDHDIESVVELGCGDGHQISLIDYPRYIGLDISKEAIAHCIERFKHDDTKKFVVYTPGNLATKSFASDVAISLEVIFHLVEDDVFDQYMRDLFNISRRFVILFTSDTEYEAPPNKAAPHVRHHAVERWVKDNLTNWTLIERMETSELRKYTYSDFYIYAKK